MFVLALFSCTDGEGSDGGVEPWSCEGESVWEDPETGLCWMRDDVYLDDEFWLNWIDSLTACSKLELEGQAGWRLPRIQELVGLVRECFSTECPVHDPDCLDSGCNNNPICEGCDGSQEYWPEDMDLGGYGYWSGSSLADYDSLAWMVQFSRGQIRSRNKFWEKNFVRCVKEGSF
jgi:hypothetical protein